MNRGIARRTVFESRVDVRFFLSRVARCVRSGLIEIHAYSILTTHFHLLVRSPEGELSVAMQRVQNAYVRWFNRSRRRDGPLFRGRFRSKRVEGERYWRNVVRYIDENPVGARVAVASRLYPYGSAYHYASMAGPIWLSRDRIEERVMLARSAQQYAPSDYALHFGRRLTASEREVIEDRISSRREEPEPEDLVAAAPEAVVRWMKRKARLADGTRPGRTWLSVASIRQQIGRERGRNANWRVRSGRVGRPGWPILESGLLRTACGLRLQEIANLQGCARSTVQTRVKLCEQLLNESREFREAAASVLRY